DHTCGPERNPQHLHDEDRNADVAEKQHVDREHDADTRETVLRVDVTLEPVVRRARAERLERLALGGLLAVEPRAAEEHAPDALALRAVRILVALAPRMMLAV